MCVCVCACVSRGVGARIKPTVSTDLGHLGKERALSHRRGFIHLFYMSSFWRCDTFLDKNRVQRNERPWFLCVFVDFGVYGWLLFVCLCVFFIRRGGWGGGAWVGGVGWVICVCVHSSRVLCTKNHFKEWEGLVCLSVAGSGEKDGRRREISVIRFVSVVLVGGVS